MFDTKYVDQIRLVLRCLPEISKQTCFALKGGTAINLFLRDLPRISVDIDLSYLPIKPRNESLQGISNALKSIKRDIFAGIDNCKITEETLQEYTIRLQVNTLNASITIEPNLILRGFVFEPQTRSLVKTAQDLFHAFVTTLTMAEPDIYGGKICAALDRQHPRDLFDIKLLLESTGLTHDIRRAFVIYLAGHDRPIGELLDPQFKDISQLHLSQFSGMARTEVTLDELYTTRQRLVQIIRKELDPAERQFLLSIKRGEPDWDILGINHIKELPAIQWKLQNLAKMEKSKHKTAVDKLRKILDI